MSRDFDITSDETLDLRDPVTHATIGRMLCLAMLDVQMSDKETLAILVDEEKRKITLKWEAAGEA